jgi:hypothetical protein
MTRYHLIIPTCHQVKILNVLFRTRTTFLLDIPADTTISQVRSAILDSRRDAAPDVQFILNGQLLHDSRLLGGLNLSASDCIVLHYPPPDRPSSASGCSSPTLIAPHTSDSRRSAQSQRTP